MCNRNPFSARRLSRLGQRHYDIARRRYLALPGADTAAPGRVEREGRIKSEGLRREDAVGPACRSGYREEYPASFVRPLEPRAGRRLPSGPRGPREPALAKLWEPEWGYLADKRSRVGHIVPCRPGIGPASGFAGKTGPGNSSQRDPEKRRRSPVRTASRTLAQRKSNSRAACRQAAKRRSECR